jgi:hypothetical protein
MIPRRHDNRKGVPQICTGGLKLDNKGRSHPDPAHPDKSHQRFLRAIKQILRSRKLDPDSAIVNIDGPNAAIRAGGRRMRAANTGRGVRVISPFEVSLQKEFLIERIRLDLDLAARISEVLCSRKPGMGEHIRLLRKKNKSPDDQGLIDILEENGKLDNAWKQLKKEDDLREELAQAGINTMSAKRELPASAFGDCIMVVEPESRDVVNTLLNTFSGINEPPDPDLYILQNVLGSIPLEDDDLLRLGIIFQIYKNGLHNVRDSFTGPVEKDHKGAHLEYSKGVQALYSWMGALRFADTGVANEGFFELEADGKLRYSETELFFSNSLRDAIGHHLHWVCNVVGESGSLASVIGR